jgi:hypothetical protein
MKKKGEKNSLTFHRELQTLMLFNVCYNYNYNIIIIII